MKCSVIDDSMVTNDKKGFLGHVSTEFEFDDLKEFAYVACKYHIAPSIFKDNVRRTDHALGTDLLCYDFDSGIKHKEIIKLIGNDHPYVILSSKNHMKFKDDGTGIRERFHVFFQLKEPITDPEYYSWLWSKYVKVFKFNDTDPLVKDITRYYYRHSNILYGSMKGEPIDPSAHLTTFKIIEKERERKQKAMLRKISLMPKSELSEFDRERACKIFIEKEIGPSIEGNGGDTNTFKAASYATRFGVDIVSIMNWYNQTHCKPQWTKKQMEHKIKQATKKIKPPYSDKFLRSLLGES